MKKIILLFALIFSSVLSFAQQSGSIEGIVKFNNKPLAGVLVVASEGGIEKGSDKTDQFGKYQIKPLSPGSYEVVFTKEGYKKNTEKNEVLVSGGSSTTASVTMIDAKKITIDGAGVRGTRIRKPPVIDPSKAGQPTPIDDKKLQRLSTTNVLDATALVAGVSKSKNGSQLGGGRLENTIIIIDGMITRNGAGNIPWGATQELEVKIGGLAANLGDATGGVISITTKGSAPKHTGSINFQRSIDGFNNNQLNVNLRGPLYKKKKFSTDSAGNYILDSKGKRTVASSRTILGYSLALGGQYDADPDPSYYPYYTVSDDLMKQLQASPLRAVQTSTGGIYFRNSAEFVTKDQLITRKSRLNGFNRAANLQGKLSFAPTKDIEITLGATTQFSSNPNYSTGNSIFASEANSVTDYFLGRGFLRFRQSLIKEDLKKDKEKSLIGKAFYQVQLNYEKSNSQSKHSVHKDNIFNYGYLGKFTQHYRNAYVFDTVAGGYTGLKFITPIFDSLTFAPSTINPNYTPYTSFVYNNLDRAPRNLGDLQQIGGFGNGGSPSSVFGLFSNVGSNVSGLNKSEVEQYSLNVDASFDINTGIKRAKQIGIDVEARHAIEFGFYYEQRTNRNYGLNAKNIWDLMRTITNSHILEYDYANPIFRVDGKDYNLSQVQAGQVTVSKFDTVNYNRKLSAENPESYFSKNLRKALGLGEGNKDFLFIDEVDPNKLKLDMFSADDLLNQGSAYVGYSGYDYLGKKETSRPSFQDFWTKKDASGNNTRPIAPFNPIYVAGYIQDNFKFKDIRFRLGMRVDRYDANQKVLKDPYSLVNSLKVGDLQKGTYALAIDGENGNAPAPDPINNKDFNEKFKNANVYVADNEVDKPKIVAYRIEDVWYDPFGKEIADPSIINSKYTNGSQLAPFIANKNDIKKDRIKSASYDVNSAFTDYKPRVNVSPRVTFSFPVDYTKDGGVKSMFYAHYDVVYQRPSAGFIYTTPDDYYFISERGGGQTLANANLNPEKKVDYEFGFQQQISPASTVKLSAAYIERKDQIQVQRRLAAWPISYETYGNRDFSTVKQFICQYELRPERFPLEMTLAYTLQFAEGTGSNATSQRSLLSSGQPNLRTIQPLDIDSRHTLVVNTDYRLGADSNAGPRIGKYHPFRRTGINFTFSGRSGEPYSRLQQVTSLYNSGLSGAQISGSLNGSRRPWTVNVDARIDKDFIFMRKGSKDGTRKSKALSFNVYASAQNLLNTRNVLAVYNYTGQADNDGFLDSPQGAQYASTVVTDANSWANFYDIALRNPGRFVNPRRIFIGFNFNF
jgi:Carboxypeptidase regulatory-like domain